MGEASDYLAFEGKSGDNFVIPSIIQFLSLLNKSGELTFSMSEQSGASMYMYEGNLTHTELNKLGGIDVVAHMFCWSYGHGKFRFRSDYKGDKILYKSLGNLVPQQILMRVMQRIDECPYKPIIQEKFKSVDDKVAIDLDRVTDADKSDLIRAEMIKRLEEKEVLTVSNLITDVFAGEKPSCKAFSELMERGIILDAENWDKEIPNEHLLSVMNIISKFTDQNIALKFLAGKKELLGLTPDKPVTLRKLRKLNSLVVKDFTKLLPQGEGRWRELNIEISKYLEKVDKELS